MFVQIPMIESAMTSHKDDPIRWGLGWENRNEGIIYIGRYRVYLSFLYGRKKDLRKRGRREELYQNRFIALHREAGTVALKLGPHELLLVRNYRKPISALEKRDKKRKIMFQTEHNRSYLNTEILWSRHRLFVSTKR